MKTRERSCDGKLRLTRQEAHDTCLQIRHRGKRQPAVRHRNIKPYHCGFCGGWHTGHSGATVLANYKRQKRIEYYPEVERDESTFSLSTLGDLDRTESETD